MRLALLADLHANLHAFEGTYGDYVSAKIGRVFPQLKQAVARDAG